MSILLSFSFVSIGDMIEISMLQSGLWLRFSINDFKKGKWLPCENSNNRHKIREWAFSFARSYLIKLREYGRDAFLLKYKSFNSLAICINFFAPLIFLLLIFCVLSNYAILLPLLVQLVHGGNPIGQQFLLRRCWSNILFCWFFGPKCYDT